MLRPVIIATEATATVIEGVQGSVDPQIKKELDDKWKKPATDMTREQEEK